MRWLGPIWGSRTTVYFSKIHKRTILKFNRQEKSYIANVINLRYYYHRPTFLAVFYCFMCNIILLYLNSQETMFNDMNNSIYQKIHLHYIDGFFPKFLILIRIIETTCILYIKDNLTFNSIFAFTLLHSIYFHIVHMTRTKSELTRNFSMFSIFNKTAIVFCYRNCFVNTFFYR